MWFGALKLFYPYICPGNEIMEQHLSAAQPTLSIPVRTWIPTTGSISRMQFSTISSVRLQYEQLSQTQVYVYRQNLVSSDYGLDTPVVFPLEAHIFLPITYLKFTVELFHPPAAFPRDTAASISSWH